MGGDEPWKGRHVMVVAAYDSFLKSALAYSRHYEALGASVSYRLLRARKNQLSPVQLRALGLDPREVVTLRVEDLVTPDELAKADVILLALNGLRSRRFVSRFHSAFTAARQRPLLVSFYPGLIFRFHLEGMSSRMGADVLLLNSPNDLSLYEGALEFMGADNRNALALGLSFLPTRAEAEAHTVPPEGSMLFIAQPTVPQRRSERLYLLERWVDLARRHPERQWLLKPRHRRDEETLHRVAHHYEDLLDELPPAPSNFAVTHEPVTELLPAASACVTFSSTAALEAACLGIPVRILTDLGVHENVGNFFFIGSGLEATLDDIEPGLEYRWNSAWADAHVRSARDHLDALDDRLEELLATQRELGRALPPPQQRLFGRSADYDAWLEEREGLASVAEFGPTPRATLKGRAAAGVRVIRGRLRSLARIVNGRRGPRS